MDIGFASGSSISLIDHQKQIVKYSQLLNVKEWPRSVSIDGHAILSKEKLLLLDASKDWRFINNPLVKGYPFIKFYIGVPILVNQIPIGILAVFDGNERASFDPKRIAGLQALSLEINGLLNSCFNAKQQCNEEITLHNRISSKTFSIPLYEKDGSGNSFKQNYVFRFGNHNEVCNKEIWEKLLAISDFKVAARTICKTIKEHLNVSVAYITEIKVIETYQTEAKYYPNKNEILSQDFKGVDKLTKIGKEKVMSRCIGNSSLSNIDTNQPGLYYQSLCSEFGLMIRNKLTNQKYKYGMCIPFYKLTSKFVHKPTDRANLEMADLYLKSGGYMITVFTNDENILNEANINYILDCTGVYRKMYFNSLN